MPQVITYQSTSAEVRGYIAEAVAILDEHDLQPAERANVLPVVVGLLSGKPIGLQPDGPALDLNALRLGRH